MQRPEREGEETGMSKVCQGYSAPAQPPQAEPGSSKAQMFQDHFLLAQTGECLGQTRASFPSPRESLTSSDTLSIPSNLNTQANERMLAWTL